MSAQGELFRAFTIYQRRRETFFARADVGPPVHYPPAIQPHWYGGCQRGRRARPQCPRVTAGYCHSPPTGTRTTQEHNTTRPTTTAPGPSGTKLSPHTRNGSIWHFLCAQGEFCTVVTTKKPSRESFVPNARQRSSEPTQQHTRPHRHGAEDTRGAAGPGRGAGCGRLVGPARVRRATARQISHAIRLGQVSKKPENVAIPTMQIQCLNKLRGNCMRN